MTDLITAEGQREEMDELRTMIQECMEEVKGKKDDGGPLSTEKIVAAIITLIVMGFCTWAAWQLNDNSQNNIKLQGKIESMSVTVADLKTEVSNLRGHANSFPLQNSKEIAVLQQQMSMLVEENKEFQNRIRQLENGK